MADGRILSKRVTRSDKVASLSSDTARMIYSWLIPYLDVEGRIEADPRLLKADIAPLLDHITPEVINNVLQELHTIGLIVLYCAPDGSKRYLQLTRFEENQKNLRKDREAPSRIPAPTSDELRTNSGPSPAKVPHNIREEKRSLREARRDEPPVDNSKNGDGSFQEKLKEAFSKIQQKKPDWNFHHQVYLFIQTHLKHGNPDALIHCLESLHKQLEAGNEIKHPKPYLDAAMKIENGKHNAREHTARAEELKIKPGEIQGINQILGAMIGGQAK
jgi:hypothetical protein